MIDKTTEVHSLPQMVAVLYLTSNYHGGNRKFYLKKVFDYFCSELIWYVDLDLFYATGLFPYLQKFFDVFKRYRKRPAAWNGLRWLGEKSLVVEQKKGNLKSKHAKFSEKETFLTQLYAHVRCVSGSKKFLFFGKYGILCFLVTSVLRFVFFPYQLRNKILFRF